ncbi:MAG: glycosyltransferase family 2 protein [Deltaproteobacteria bacterium]|nr:glycosyltransferase family 2 protein [Deltaproteobacteria bacterium]
MPRVSVIIPAYNNAALLGETLDSVVRQSFRDFELIVVDDGSTDDTAAIVQRDYPHLKFVRQANGGPASARNAGVKLSQGEFIAFCDHDDLWHPEHVQTLVGEFSTYPNAALVFDNGEYFGVGVDPHKLHLANGVCAGLRDKPVSAKTLLWDYPIASMSVTMVRKDIFDRLGGLSEDVGALDDLHFYLRLAAHHEVRFVDYLGCKKRLTGQNLSQLINIKETNVGYLEELWRNHPEVVRAIGASSFRLRLARKYFKLGRYYKDSGDRALSKQMFGKAFRTNFLNLRYFWHGLLG